MASTAVFCFALIIIMGGVGGELEATGPPAAAGGELKATGAPAAGGGELKVTGPAAAGGELKPPRSASAVELLPPGSAASEFMPAGSAGVSALLRHELSLVNLGSNCSGIFCVWCLVKNIGPCLADAVSCEDDPLIIVQCLVGKFSIIAGCFGGIVGGQLTITGSASAGATATELVPGSGSAGAATASASTARRSVGGGSPATASARTARLSALLRNELAISGLGISCSGDCVMCLTNTIASCFVDAVVCFNPFKLAVCFAENVYTMVGCFST